MSIKLTENMMEKASEILGVVLRLESRVVFQSVCVDMGGGKLTEMSLQKSSREGWRGAWYPDFRQFGVNKLKN